MTIRRIYLTISAFLLTISCMAQEPQALQVRQLTLKNGMTVWLNEDHSQPKIYGAVVVRAGAKDCPGTGIAHYFEHIMFKGTDRIGTTDYAAEKPWLDSISAQYDLLAQTTEAVRRTEIQQKINQLSLKAADYAIPNEFNRLVSRFGGSDLNAATGYDVTYYHNLFLPQYLRQWCHLNSERILHPVFRLFQGELENVYEEKNRSEDAMGGALEKAMRAIFGSHPYAEPILGSTESLKNPRLSEMEAFYRKYYVGSNMGLILCGDLPAEDIEPILEQTFGRLPQGEPIDRGGDKPFSVERKRIDIRLPIPIIKAEALVFQAPTDYEADAQALDLCNQLLSNGKAGLLDSLGNEHVVMAAVAARTAFNDAGVQFMLVIPKIIFGKMKKAERICLEQVERIKQGDFSEETLQQLKRNMLTEMEQDMETIDGRAELMLDAFSQGRSWQDVLDQKERISRLTKQEVVNAARKYYTSNYLTLHKKYGTEPKETLSQPGYEPVKPKNAGAKSAYAKELEQMPVDRRAIRLVDYDRDAHLTRLSPTVELYTKENPINDIFTFTLRYLKGREAVPLTEPLATYLNSIGTDSLKKQQLESAWQRLGIDVRYEAEKKVFSISLTGREEQLEPALRLLNHFLGHAKADKEALKELKDSKKVDYKAFGKTKEEVMPAMLGRVMYGQASPYLLQPSLKEVKKLTSEQLLALFAELQQSACQLFYCGKRPTDDIARLAQQCLPLAKAQQPRPDVYKKTLSYDTPTVFFYHVPKSRQNYILTYEQTAPTPTPQQEATAKLWSQYMGEGMSSVLFQNIREYQSLAYSTRGILRTPSLAQHPNDPLCYVTITGTQADKTLQTMSAIDSLMRHMPMKEENLEAARQEMQNELQTNYPTFREVATHIANHRLVGYEQNPNEQLISHVPTLSAQAIETYHRQYIAPNNRVWIIIGDRKQTDLSAIAKYGKIIELTKEDVYK